MTHTFPRAWRLLQKTLIVAVIAVCVLFGAGPFAARFIMAKMLTTGPNGPETPASMGAPFVQAEIPSGSRRLKSYVVTAPSSCANPPVLLIYHGIQETVSEWSKAQAFLYGHCVSSVTFDPTGSGNSPRPTSLDAIGEDSIAAYEFTIKRFPASRVFVFGHSMGNGLMIEAVPHFSSPPTGVIIANAFASLRSHPKTTGNLLYRLLSYTIPDWWDNVKAVRDIHAPVLVVHSDTDGVNPVEGCRSIYAAAQQPKKLAILHGYRHNDLYRNPTEQWWQPVLGFLKDHSETR